MDKTLLKEYAQKLVHCIHGLDARQTPFKDDEEYEAYLWEIERILFKFWETGLRNDYGVK